MTVAAVVVAAGTSTRFGEDKLAWKLAGREVWRWSVGTFLAHPAVRDVVLVTSGDLLGTAAQVEPGITAVVAGGESRQGSVAYGLKALASDVEWVLIHDAARPLVRPALVDRVLEAAKTAGAAYPALPVADTLRRTDGEIVDRTGLLAVQTPQCGRREDFLRAHGAATGIATDDVALLAEIGILAASVPGDPSALKLTHPADREVVESFLVPGETRTGLGYDIHAFSTDPERPMMLGGIEFDSRPGLDGHSDADALIHAVVDALLGAASLGDIGEHFPNTDSDWKNRPSSYFLREAARMLADRGWDIVNIDCSVVAERPKIMVRKHEIIAALAAATEIDPGRVSVKATTNERLGAVGRGEGVAAFAVAQIRRKPAWS